MAETDGRMPNANGSSERCESARSLRLKSVSHRHRHFALVLFRRGRKPEGQARLSCDRVGRGLRWFFLHGQRTFLRFDHFQARCLFALRSFSHCDLKKKMYLNKNGDHHSEVVASGKKV